MNKVEIAHTQTVDDIIMAVSFAEAAGDISLIYGDAGLGKTVSLKEYTKMQPDVIYIELKDCDKSVKGVCEKILSCIGKTLAHLQKQCRLSNPGITAHQYQGTLYDPAAKHPVKLLHAGGHPLFLRHLNL